MVGIHPDGLGEGRVPFSSIMLERRQTTGWRSGTTGRRRQVEERDYRQAEERDNRQEEAGGGGGLQAGGQKAPPHH